MDMISYALGAKDGEKKGKQTIELAGDSYTFTDTDGGNIVITEVSSSSDTSEKGE